MKKSKIILFILCLPFLFSGCITMEEPNDLAYVVALGIDQSEEYGEYNFTIQFAKPIQISGSGSEEGGGGGSGEGMMENLTFTAPTIYTAINLANQIVSKRFTMSHAKLIVFSREIAANGIRDFMETMVRNMEIRPNIYMAVSLSSAKDYLDKVKPLIETDPAKYYQLIYENNYSIYTPNNVSQEFYFSQSSPESENVLPIANIMPEKQGSDENSSASGKGGGESGSSGSASEGENSSGGSENGSSFDTSSGKEEMPDMLSSPIPMKQGGFEYRVKNYLAGDVVRNSDNQSEILGMAVFHGDTMIGVSGSVEAQLYNLMKGSFYATNISFPNPNNQNKSTTIRVEQMKKPKISVDVSGDHPVGHIKLCLSGEFYSLPADCIVEKDVEKYELQAQQSTRNAVRDFLFKTSREYQADIVGFGSYAKRKFLTYQKFRDYKWEEQYPYMDFDVQVDFRIKRSGLTIRTGEE